MRHPITFDGLVVLDVGRTVSRVQINHQKFGTPKELGGSVVDYLVRHHSRMRSAALDLLIEQHSLLFPYEDGTEARDRLELLLSDQTAAEVTDGGVLPEPWQIGDALRLELVIKAAELRIIDRTPADLTEFAITEMTRNAYRRLHSLELPVVRWFFSVFLQTTQPTQLPLDVLVASAIDYRKLTPTEAAEVMKGNANFWKAELQSIGNSYLMATCSDPRLMTLQNAALYQQIKRFFGEEA